MTMEEYATIVDELRGRGFRICDLEQPTHMRPTWRVNYMRPDRRKAEAVESRSADAVGAGLAKLLAEVA
jgi:hypothetical protein